MIWTSPNRPFFFRDPLMRPAGKTPLTNPANGGGIAKLDTRKNSVI